MDAGLPDSHAPWPAASSGGFDAQHVADQAAATASATWHTDPALSGPAAAAALATAARLQRVPPPLPYGRRVADTSAGQVWPSQARHALHLSSNNCSSHRLALKVWRFPFFFFIMLQGLLNCFCLRVDSLYFEVSALPWFACLVRRPLGCRFRRTTTCCRGSATTGGGPRPWRSWRMGGSTLGRSCTSHIDGDR